MQERAKSNLLHSLSPSSWKIKLSLRATTPRPTPRMVMRQCSDTSTPGDQYSLTRRNVKRLGKCGLNQLQPTEKVVLRITRRLVAERIRIVSVDVQIYVAWLWR